MGNFLSEPPCPKLNFQSECCISVYGGGTPVSAAAKDKTDMTEPPQKKQKWSTAKGTKWTLTTAKFDRELQQALMDCDEFKVACASIERAQDGHEHIQAYVETNRQVRASQFSTWFPAEDGGCRFMVWPATDRPECSVAYVMNKAKWHEWAKTIAGKDHWSEQGAVFLAKNVEKLHLKDLYAQEITSAPDVPTKVSLAMQRGATVHEVAQAYPGWFITHQAQVVSMRRHVKEWANGDHDSSWWVIKESLPRSNW